MVLKRSLLFILLPFVGLTAQTGDVDGTPTFGGVHANSPSGPVIYADLTVIQLAPAAIGVAPDSVGADLFTGGTSTETLTIENLSVDSSLVWALEVQIPPDTVTFTKADYADWTLPENQDRITDNVWITRADIQGLFNIQTESFYSLTSPDDTEWAIGMTKDLLPADYQAWRAAVDAFPPLMTAPDLIMSLHLISDDLYFDLDFHSWTSSGGGGFSYTRTNVRPDWLTVSQDSGAVLPASSQMIDVTFDASGLGGGEYDGQMVIASNDTANPEVIVKAHLNVTSAPDIAVSSDTLDYGVVFMGYPVTKTLVVSNAGFDSLTVSDIVTDNAAFTVDTTAFVLYPGEAQPVKVTFDPGSLGLFSGALTITSDDPYESPYMVTLSGDGQLPPVMVVVPDSLYALLDPGDIALRTITIDNSAGSYDLIWQALPTLAESLEVVATSPQFSLEQGTREAKESAASQPFSRRVPGDIFSFEGLTGPQAAKRGGEATAGESPPPSLEGVLEHLDAGFGAVTAVIPDLYDFEYDGGDSPGYISDGGGDDMYDGGNYLSTDLSGGADLDYTNGVIQADAAFGPNGRYFTREYPGLFVLVADLDGVASFETNGNNGADGSGAAIGAVLEMEIGGKPFYGMLKQIFGAGDPSINHLMIVTDPLVSHAFATDTNDDYHRVFNLSASPRLYYILYSSYSAASEEEDGEGTLISNEAALQIMATFLDILRIPPSWITATPDAGTLPAGGTAEVEVEISAEIHRGNVSTAGLLITSNDPVTPAALVRIELDVYPLARPIVTQIADVPGDQGGWVTAGWNASLDDRGESDHQVLFYSVWLKDTRPPGAAAYEPGLTQSEPKTGGAYTMTGSNGALGKDEGLSGRDRLMAKLGIQEQSSALGGKLQGVGPASPGRQEAMEFSPPEGLAATEGWLGVGSIGATQAAGYTFLVPTLADSNQTGTNWSQVKISAHTAEDPSSYIFSPVDSGYSLDNIAPSVPLLQAVIPTDTSVLISWAPVPEEDFQYFAVYRGDESGFDPVTVGVHATTADTFFSEGGLPAHATLFYRLSAVDFTGNESPYSDEKGVTLLNTPPGSFALLDLGSDTTVVIGQGNLGDTLTISWEAALDVNGDEVEYGVEVTGNLGIIFIITDLAATSLSLANEAIVAAMEVAGVITVSGTWTIFANDGIDTTWADAGPVSLTLDVLLGVYEYAGIPEVFSLHQNYPNPFNPTTTLLVDVPYMSRVSVVIYDLLGREVIRLVDGNLPAAYHRIVWNGKTGTDREVPTGVYIAWMVTEEYTKSIKMILLK